MKISLTNAGKRFNRDWIFRKLSQEFTVGHSYAIVGPNGSGKSTLLQAIAGSLQLSEGTVDYFTHDQQKIAAELVFKHVSLAAPYLELIEEMTAKEFLEFHGQFKTFLPGKTVVGILEEVGLTKAADKQIRYFSSGMKQRMKLAQAVFSDTTLLLLDEPCTNLDQEGIALYQKLISNYSTNRIVVISSNDVQEYGNCEERVEILKHK
ncbi:MAG: ATP-binding cassette domain-containing protein [Chitinophagaceae bacterium]|uniref:ABC transporter ATP-binding protein n=1 Tax=unclassified Paraflavitalea TaxID=2798305 RepID=UPI003D348473|nr:ATP-binding cassette domain-containing protein [Chitinophagaceae bacterium]